MLRMLRFLLIFLTTLYGVFVGYLYIAQDTMVFNVASGTYPGSYKFPENTEEVWITPDEGVRLHGAIFKADGPRRGVVIYYKGNAGHIGYSPRMAETFTALGFDVLSMDYRRFGLSTGELSEEATLADALAWYDFAQKRYSGEDVRVVGYSLGSTFASYVTNRRSVENLILFSPMKSLIDVANRRFPFIPDYVSRYHFPNDEWLRGASSSSIHAYHGDLDTIVPLESGIELEPILNADDSFTVINGAGHNDLPWRDEVLSSVRQRWGR